MYPANLCQALKTEKAKIRFAWLFCCLFTFATLFLVEPVDDDLHFTKQLLKIGPLNWQIQRYKTWSGRVFSEFAASIFYLQPIILWRIVNTAMLILLVYSIIRIIFRTITPSSIILTFSAIWLMAPEVMKHGGYWMAGSFAYLWPLALGLFASIYLSDQYAGEKTKYPYIYIFCALPASLGEEQIGLCIIAFSLILQIKLFFNKHHLNPKLVLFSILSILGLGIDMLSPGTKIRYVEESKFWYPDFPQLSLLSKVGRGIVWHFSFTTVYMLLIFAVCVCTLLIANQKTNFTSQLTNSEDSTLQIRNNLLFWVQGVSALCLILVPSANLLHIQQFIFNFDNLASPHFISKLLPYLFWVVFLLSLITFMTLMVKRKMILIFLVLASVCSTAIMYFTPTIVATGTRSLFVPSILLSMALLEVVAERPNRLYYLVIGGPALINAASLFMNFSVVR